MACVEPRLLRRTLSVKLLNILACAALACLAWASVADAAGVRAPARGLLVRADWQSPQALPRRFRNHCLFDRGRLYCSDHCGFGYQFYYCSRRSFGCCRVGFGYCDWSGLLRCAP